MKKITIKGEDIARIPLWKTLGKPKDDEEIVLYQLEDGESFPVEKPVILQNAVKEKIVEMIDKYIEHLETSHVKGNEYLTNRYEGKVDALETLMIELMRDSILSK